LNAFLSGKKVKLGRLDTSDSHIQRMATWLDDDRVTRLLFAGLMPADPDTIRQEWEHNLRDPNEIVFQVQACLPTRDVFIGTAGLYLINWVARTAEYRIFLGDMGCWGKGYGTEATRLVLRYALEKLNLHSVYLGVNKANRAAVRVYEKAGFVYEGVLRQIYYRNGQYYDVARMSILREEYDAL